MKLFKKTFLTVLIAIPSTFSLSILANMYQYQYGFTDAFFRTLLAPIEGTIWSESFSEENFSKIKIGTTAERVRELLGAPLDISCKEYGCYWTYTEQENSTPGYNQRWLIFDQNKKVKEIRKTFLLD